MNEEAINLCLYECYNRSSKSLASAIFTLLSLRYFMTRTFLVLKGITKNFEMLKHFVQIS